jgi:hypothetical protein
MTAPEAHALALEGNAPKLDQLEHFHEAVRKSCKEGRFSMSYDASLLSNSTVTYLTHVEGYSLSRVSDPRDGDYYTVQW